MSNTAICWSCHSQTAPASFFCDACHIVQPLVGLNPFEIMGISEAFIIDPKLLDHQYFERQKLLHPDRFATKTSKEKMYASQQAMAVNDAYNLLKSPLDRADYLCVVLGGESYKDETRKNVNPQILMASMMMREALGQAKDEAALNEMLQKNQKKQDEVVNNISKFYNEKNIAALENEILSFQYERRFMQEIKEKIAKVKGGNMATPMAFPL
ncbi:MAG: Fe-S protein assembly co-chaperone HscB [Alphaproteobacteria bacterium]